jgi:hypothetical protein
MKGMNVTKLRKDVIGYNFKIITKISTKIIIARNIKDTFLEKRGAHGTFAHQSLSLSPRPPSFLETRLDE